MTLYRRPSGIFHYDIRHGEHRDAGSTGTRNKRAASQMYNERKRMFRFPSSPEEGEIMVFAPETTARGRPGGRVTLGEVAESYLTKVVPMMPNSQNKRLRKSTVAMIVERLGRDTPFFSITEDHLEPICRYHEDRGVSPRTVNAYVLEPVQALYAHASRRMKLHAPCAVYWGAVRRRVDNDRTRVLMPEEMKRLLAVLDHKEGLLHEFAWTVGLRAMEVVRLRWSDVDRAGRMIATRVKGGRVHGVPISDRVAEILDEFEGDHDEFVFTYEARQTWRKRGIVMGDRVPYAYGVLLHRTRIALRKAKIDDYRFHDHRHTAASRMLRVCNGNMRVVQQLLGHRHLVSCHRYGHLHGGAVAVELEKLPSSR